MPVPAKLYGPVAKNIYRRGVTALVIFLLVLAGLEYLVFDLVVPKTATLTIPQKWRMLPLRQSRTIVHGFLGEPIPQKNATDSAYEEWGSGSKGKRYLLRIGYASDTIVVSYAIYYHYTNRLVDKDYLIDSVSVRE